MSVGNGRLQRLELDCRACYSGHCCRKCHRLDDNRLLQHRYLDHTRNNSLPQQNQLAQPEVELLAHTDVQTCGKVRCEERQDVSGLCIHVHSSDFAQILCDGVLLLTRPELGLLGFQMPTESQVRKLFQR